MGLSRQKYWSGLPCPPPGDLPNPGIELAHLMFPALTGGFFATSAIREGRVGSRTEAELAAASLLCPGCLALGR